MLMGKCCSLIFAQMLMVIYGEDYVKQLSYYTLGSEYNYILCSTEKLLLQSVDTPKRSYIMYNFI